MRLIFQLYIYLDLRNSEQARHVIALNTVYISSTGHVQSDQVKVNSTKPVTAFSEQDENKLSCNFCGKIYKQTGFLLKHLKTNHEFVDTVTFRCKKCNKLFETQKKLTRHEKSKTDCSK